MRAPASGLVAAVLWLSSPALAQVPNPSFESFSPCPDTQDQMDRVDDWFRPTTGTSDYFNACASPGEVGVPVNFIGSQDARTGDAYVGLSTYLELMGAPVDAREYVEVALSAPLAAGETYEVSFFASLAEFAQFSSDGLGAHLSIGAVTSLDPLVLPVVPQVSSASLLTDAANWVEVKGSFVAGGGEDHLTIGNFFDDASTTVQATGVPPAGPIAGAYYYIDDVSVTLAQPDLAVPAFPAAWPVALLAALLLGAACRLRA